MSKVSRKNPAERDDSGYSEIVGWCQAMAGLEQWLNLERFFLDDKGKLNPPVHGYFSFIFNRLRFQDDNAGKGTNHSAKRHACGSGHVKHLSCSGLLLYRRPESPITPRRYVKDARHQYAPRRTIRRQVSLRSDPQSQQRWPWFKGVRTNERTIP